MFVLISSVPDWLNPIGLIIAFIAYDIDIRNHGSKNIGMSIFTTVGLKPGLLTLMRCVDVHMALSPFTSFRATLIACCLIWPLLFSISSR